MELSLLTLEECALRAWPALTTRHYDGWLLRFANGYTRRANSINPMYSSSLAVEAKIDYCETLYREQGLKTCFRLTEAFYPAHLETLLIERQYALITPTSVQTLDLSAVEPALSPEIDGSPRLTNEWLRESVRIGETKTAHLLHIQQIIGACRLPMVFLSLRQEEQVIAQGMGVHDGDYIGLFKIVTDARYRRRGFGEQIVAGLLSWGKTNGAKVAYLQVEQSNAPALALYRKLGFRQFYAYRYWEKAA